MAAHAAALIDGSPISIRLGGQQLIARPELVREIDVVDALLEVIVAATAMAGGFSRSLGMPVAVSTAPA